MSLNQALICIAIQLQLPFPRQTHTLVQILGVAAKDPNQEINGGNRAARVGLLHLRDDRADLIEPVGVGRLGEDEQYAVVGDGVVLKIRGKRRAGPEKFQGEARAVYGFEDLGRFRGREGGGERVEEAGQAREGVVIADTGLAVRGQRRRVAETAAMENVGGGADKVAAGDRVAPDVGGERWRRGDLRREGAAGGRD